MLAYRSPDAMAKAMPGDDGLLADGLLADGLLADGLLADVLLALVEGGELRTPIDLP